MVTTLYVRRDGRGRPASARGNVRRACAVNSEHVHTQDGGSDVFSNNYHRDFTAATKQQQYIVIIIIIIIYRARSTKRFSPWRIRNRPVCLKTYPIGLGAFDITSADCTDVFDLVFYRSIRSTFTTVRNRIIFGSLNALGRFLL